MRQHVNPLSSFFQLPRQLPPFEELFEEDHLPVHLDIGSAGGEFLLSLAHHQPNWNHIGLEIRERLVKSSESKRKERGLSNLRFLFCNANVSLKEWFDQNPEITFEVVSIQFPDPWFKKRHRKRRVLSPSLLLEISNALNVGGQLFLQSDILDIIEDMKSLVNLSGCFDIKTKDNCKWLDQNPFLFLTERENYAMSRKLPVYRVMFCRNSKKFPDFKDFEKRYQLIT